jgi:hypothetical protein
MTSLEPIQKRTDFSPVAGDRSWVRFSDYKLTSALKRLQYSEQVSASNLHAVNRAKNTKSLGINAFYRNNFEA